MSKKQKVVVVVVLVAAALLGFVIRFSPEAIRIFEHIATYF